MKFVQTNRIPTEGLKPVSIRLYPQLLQGPNQQNPDRGIETLTRKMYYNSLTGPNQQNPDRGIETGLPNFVATSTSMVQTNRIPTEGLKRSVDKLLGTNRGVQTNRIPTEGLKRPSGAAAAAAAAESKPTESRPRD